MEKRNGRENEVDNETIKEFKKERRAVEEREGKMEKKVEELEKKWEEGLKLVEGRRA